jgi:outer membrane lipopolysaccharide assembly protein LptE/RlpB
MVGCGYHLTGTTSVLPENIRTLAIPLFENKSAQPAIEQIFTDAMVERFLSLPKLKITNSKDAQAIFYGIIKSYSYEQPLAFDRSLDVTEYQLEVVLDASIREVGTNKNLWERKNIRKTTEFSAVGGLTEKNIAEDEAARQAAGELARRVFGLLEGF